MRISRRKFLATSTAVGGFLAARPLRAFGKSKDALRVAVVGAGGRGKVCVQAFSGISENEIGGFDGKLGGALKAVENVAPPTKISAVCDVDWNFAADSLKVLPDVPKFRDYRKMFDKMSSEIDAVAISVPDHMHYPIAAWAISLGKHVFIEKPLSRTVWESREIASLAKKAGVVAQMGNQGATSEGWRVLREWYNAGLLGKIEDIYCLTPCPIWPQGKITPPAPQKIPDGLDYGLWLGVAPDSPYSKDVLPFNWRGLRNYASGAVGDMACHLIEPPFNAFDMQLPKTVKCVCDISSINSYTWPDSSEIHFEFDSPFGKDGKIRLHWYDGGRMPKFIRGVEIKSLMSKSFNYERPNNALFVVGSQRTVRVGLYGKGIAALPNAEMAELKKGKMLPPKTIARSAFPMNPQMEFAAACLEGSALSVSFERSAALAETALLGAASMAMSGKTLRYDAEKMSFGSKLDDMHLRSLYPYRSEFLP